MNTRKNLVGSARAGALGFNAHAANVIAALFIACGQDPAHVVEGSLAVTTVDPAPGGAYVAVTLPALPLGTVGGGTAIETQAECLGMLGVAGGGDPPGEHAKAFAEIVAAGVLAGRSPCSPRRPPGTSRAPTRLSGGASGTSASSSARPRRSRSTRGW